MAALFHSTSILIQKIRQSLFAKLVVTTVIALQLILFVWIYFDINLQNRVVVLAGFFAGFVVISIGHFYLATVFVKQPINKLINKIQMIAKGEFSEEISVNRNSEISQLELAINTMGKEINAKQNELNKQRNEYQNLFEQVPCFITVQDRNYRILRYNSEFSKTFDSKIGDYCYSAYKNRNEKCESCPVKETFADGLPHASVEAGLNKRNEMTYWVVRTSPITNEKGEIVAALEMCMDITPRKQLEEKLEKSEKKYFAIFNNIPNAVFVLEQSSLAVIDCNEVVREMYGYSRDEILNTSFMNLFMEEERETFKEKIMTSSFLDKIYHVTKNGNCISVNIRISPSEFPELKVFIVTTSDITRLVETELQLIQAGKMATLGQMATGIAHELNQPLTVIKTASNYIIKKVNQRATIEKDILHTMSKEIDSHVDRATKIINHLRQFGRKSDMILEEVNLNKVIKKSFEIFNRQLKLREIEVVWDLEEGIAPISADPNALEQVFVNLLLNARDVLEEKWKTGKQPLSGKMIKLTTKNEKDNVVAEVEDSGTGISDVILDKIFEPFFTTKKVGQGTGLGLSISYSIVKECGGNIYAESKKNAGTRFVVEFPKAETDK